MRIQEQVDARFNQRYTIAIPEHYTGDQAAPLVVALHWGGTIRAFYGREMLEYLIEPALSSLDAILVAPDCQHGNWTNVHSQAAVVRLLATLHESYHLDDRRTLITGYSLGGAGTWYLAARHQDRFAAALPISGWPQLDSAEVEWKIPLYVIHSRQDEVAPFERTARVVKQLQTKHAPVQFVRLDGVTHYETERFVEPLRAAIPWIHQAWSKP